MHPAVPARPPNPRRHAVARITRRSLKRTLNHVVEPWVDMAADIDAINQGGALRDGNVWTVHGRRYVVDADGHTYPAGGRGVHALDRGAFRALGIYNDLGETAAAELQCDREAITQVARLQARRVRALAER